MEDLAEHYKRWNTQKTNEVTSAGKKIQDKMYRALPGLTPVRRDVAEVRHITANRYNGHAAIRVKAPDKEQPGQTKVGWSRFTKTDGGRTIYAVRNKNRPTVIHLLNFDHAHFSHGKRTGITKGTGFVDRVQNEGAEELHREIERIFEREE